MKRRRCVRLAESVCVKPALVISDTGPIISLLKINQLYLLKDIFSEVIIPKKVYQELMAGSYPNERAILNRIDFIRQQEVKTKYRLQHVPKSVHAGEAEAIALARQLTAETKQRVRLLVDDGSARTYARGLGIKIIGTIGTLRYARLTERIDSDAQINEIIRTFQSLGRFYSQQNYNYLLHGDAEKVKQTFAELDFKEILKQVAKSFEEENIKKHWE